MENLKEIDVESLSLKFKDTEIVHPVYAINFGSKTVTYFSLGRLFDTHFDNVEFLAKEQED